MVGGLELLVDSECVAEHVRDKDTRGDLLRGCLSDTAVVRM